MEWAEISADLCLCARKPHGRGQMHGMALGKPAWTCCRVCGWAAPFRLLWEYSGCWSGFFPSPKKPRYKRLQIYNFPINEIKMWPNTNCKQGRDLCTEKWHWSSDILGDMEDFSDLFLLTPFSLECTKQMVVSMSDYSWGKPPDFRLTRPGKSLRLDSSSHLCLIKLGITKDAPNSGLWINN